MAAPFRPVIGARSITGKRNGFPSPGAEAIVWDMDSREYHAALAALDWQLELGADEAIADAPIDRYALAQKPAVQKPAPSASPVTAPQSDHGVTGDVDPVVAAQTAAAHAHDLAGLKAALADYPHCELRHGARNLVFADGQAGAPLMIVGEAPGRDEDREGRPFVGRAGQLLDRMLAAIDHDRARNVYITNVLPWRPPQNRDPTAEEIAMMQPFIRRHIALAAPKVLIVMGNIACDALLGRRGITRLRGTWSSAESLPAMPMFHPAYLLRNPSAKRATWSDLLDVRARLEGS